MRLLHDERNLARRRRPEAPREDVACVVEKARRGIRLLPVERFVEGRAEAELVAAFVGRDAAHLLGRHVPGCSEDGSRLREPALRRVGRARPVIHRRRVDGRVGDVGGEARDEPREAEVGDAHAAVAPHEHVVGLEIAMDEAASMRRHEPRGGLQVDAQAQRHLARLAEIALPLPLGEGGAVDELHRDEDAPARLARLVDVHDVGVRDAGHGLRLLLDARRGEGGLVAEVAHELDGDLAIEFGVVGGEDLPHPALSHALDDQEAPDARRRIDGRVVRRLRRCRVHRGGELDGAASHRPSDHRS